MKVRIAYSMELEEVPDQISKIFREQSEHLCDATKLLSISIDLLDGKSADMSLKAMEKTRQKLADIDSVLNEMAALLEGYISATADPSLNEDDASPATAPRPGTQYSVPVENPQNEADLGGD
jgi:hypothetical protein